MIKKGELPPFFLAYIVYNVSIIQLDAEEA